MTRRSRYDTSFGSSVSIALAEANLCQNSLANITRVSPSYLNKMMTGRKVVPPEWVDTIASALKLADDRRRKLHAAAAKDAGYDLDLTKA